MTPRAAEIGRFAGFEPVFSAMTRDKPRPPTGRYDLAGARAPANGLGRPPASLNARTAVGAVTEPPPFGDGTERLCVAVNWRVDILEVERSHSRISEAAYQVGRIAQAVFERARGPGTSSWAGNVRVDAYTAKELAIIHAIEDARRIQAQVAWMRYELGRIDANIVQRVLGEGKTYAEVATLTGKRGERGKSHIAERFRDALEALADAKAARGRAR